MENSYGIGVFNRYALFYDENEDPLETLKENEKNKDIKKKKKSLPNTEKENKQKAASPVKLPAKKISKGVEEKKEVKKEKIQKNVIPPSEPKQVDNYKPRPLRQPIEKQVRPAYDATVREERYIPKNKEAYPDKSIKEVKDKPEREFKNYNRKDTVPPPRFEYERGKPGRGRIRGGRGRAMRNGWSIRGKREYDRQSGSDKTGVKAVEKREGAGSYNWGREDEIIDTHEQAKNGLSDGQGDTWNGTDSPGETVTEQPIPNGEVSLPSPKEEPAREMTLDEWKKLQESNRSRPQYNLRKAGEGEDSTQWSGGILLRKKDVVPTPEPDEDEMVSDGEDAQRRSRPKPIPIDITFADARRGRGRGRGMRGTRAASRGALRGNVTGNFRERTERDRSQRQNAPRVDDETDFPSLE